LTSRIAVLGGGAGLGSVLRGLRDHDAELTVIVGTAEDASLTGVPRPAEPGSAVADLRRSLEALTDDELALARAIRRPLQIDRLGRHPLGSLVIQSLAGAFGDLGKASTWLGTQLGIAGAVLPVTIEPVGLIIDTGGLPLAGFPSDSEQSVDRLRFEPERPEVSGTILDAIERADWVLLAPGSLYSSVLATSAIPDVASALQVTRARVGWICNLEPGAGETAEDHLRALRGHGVRVDAVMYDPGATLHFSPEWLAGQGIEALPSRLSGPKPGRHDPELLRGALGQWVGSPRPLPAR
jgi:uncharacterized cofD-like protein